MQPTGEQLNSSSSKREWLLLVASWDGDPSSPTTAWSVSFSLSPCRNKQSSSDSLDLHGLHVSEALEALQEKLATTRRGQTRVTSAPHSSFNMFVGIPQVSVFR